MSVAGAVVKRPVLWLVVFALVSVCGIFLFSDIAFDMLPEVEVPYLSVITTYPGADPETVEKSVTDVLEAGLVNTDGISKMTSVSMEQSSVILLEFDYGTNIDAKINRVRENIDLVKAALPDTADAPLVMQAKANDDPIMVVGISGREFSQNELRAFARDNIRDQLRQIEGVASCDIEGGQDAIVRVGIFQNRLEAYGITISEIAGALAAQNVQLGAGSIEDGLVEYSIKTSGEYDSAAAIADTVVARINGADIRLGDIGEAALDYAEEKSAVYINGEPGVYLSVMKQSGANTVRIADRVYRRLETIRRTLPQGIDLAVIRDDTTEIRGMIQELVNSAIIGVVLAVAVLVLFFRNINSAVIIALSIPISFLITLLAMSLAHITINMMTLAGLILGLGMVVGCSIVVLEGVVKFREKGENPSIAAVLAGEEVMSSIIASTVTTICVFLPIWLFRNRLEIIGLLVQDMLFTIGIALLSSLFVAIFLVPVLASKWLPVHSRLQKPLRGRFSSFIDRSIASALDALNQAYGRLLAKSLKYRLLTVLLVAAIFAVSILALAKIDIVMFPEMENGSVTVDITMPLGTRYEDTRAVALELHEYAIAEITGTKNITARIGKTAAMSDEGNNTASVTVVLDLDDPRADSSGMVKEKLRRRFSAFPNAAFAFGEDDFAALIGADIDIVLRSDDLSRGLADTEAVRALLEEKVPEVQDIAVDTNAGLPQVTVTIDRERAYNMGLSISSIANEIAASVNGVTATVFRQGGDEYDVTLQLVKEDRYELPDLGRIFVRSSTGALFPVSNFANFEKTLEPERINHEGQARTIHITAKLREGASLNQTEAAIRTLLAGQGIDAEFAGESAETGDMLQTFMLVIILAILLVFGVMAAQYESFRDPIINFCTIPLMLIGVAAIHLVTGQAMNAFTMIGFVMLPGIVVNNGILLVDYTNLLVRRGTPLMDACLEAGVSRFRPVLMTTLTTMLGLAPMAFFPGKSSMMIAPIGLALFGGLTSATIITLFFIPVMYSLINKESEK
ncbi:MAG: efflux RND transporter permease subunit [Treponema sp.]|jgi:HAE1 family hydrophobic/amphiphilic exporter-1|nr:efflux RND transporter permease subunit [Treponema sp.]